MGRFNGAGCSGDGYLACSPVIKGALVGFDTMSASGISIFGTRLALKGSVGALNREGNLTARWRTRNWLM